MIYFFCIFLISLSITFFHKPTYSKFFYIYEFYDRFLPSNISQYTIKKKESTQDYEKPKKQDYGKLEKEVKKKKKKIHTQSI